MAYTTDVFGIVDYTLFFGMLLISGGIGVFYACKGQKSAADALVGGKSMGVLPVAASIMATFMSAVGLIGVPAEVYSYGTQLMFAWLVVVTPLLTFLTSFFIVPVFYNLGTPSANEYLERRFGKIMRVAACILYCGTMVFYMGVSLFAPAMSLAQVTGLAPWITIWTTGIICTFYTAFGGLKAVVWSDTFQSLVMFVALIWIIIKGVVDSGGLGQIWKDNYDTGRIEIVDFDPNPYTRVTFWSTVFGGTISMLGAYGTNQATIQRYLALPTLRDAQKAVWSAMPLFTIVNLLTLGIAMIIVSKYHDCDPIKTRQVYTADQLFPLFVMDTMGSIPGIPGIFMAGLFSASLSTISSGINSVAAVLLEDIIRPCLGRRKLSDTAAVRLIKVLSIVFGVLSMTTAMTVQKLGNIIQATMVVFGLLGSPMFGVFILGLFVPWANRIGALIGLLVGFSFNLWMGLGNLYQQPYYPTIEKDYVDGCPDLYFNITGKMFNLTEHQAMIQSQVERTSEIFPIYRISFMYYMLIGVLIVVTIGTLFSFITGAQDIQELDTNLLVPLVKDAVEKRQRRKTPDDDEPAPEVVYMLRKKGLDGEEELKSPVSPVDFNRNMSRKFNGTDL